jgi:hypothetical protein
MEYRIRRVDGRYQEYIAGPTDASLKRNLPVGTSIRKRWGELSYEINGKRVGFPLAGYSMVLGIPFACLSGHGCNGVENQKSSAKRPKLSVYREQ